jgi:hypothetical protein
MARKAAVKNVEPASVREVREWANGNGHSVGARGALAGSVREAFTAATGRPVLSGPTTAQGAEAR